MRTDARQKEAAQLTEEQLAQTLLPAIQKLNNERGVLDIAAIKLHLRDQGINITQWKAYNLKNNLMQSHEDLFEQ